MPTTLVLGRTDAVTKGTPVGSVTGQPQLHVEVLHGVAHWVPEQRPQAVIDWAQRLDPVTDAMASETTLP